MNISHYINIFLASISLNQKYVIYIFNSEIFYVPHVTSCFVVFIMNRLLIGSTLQYMCTYAVTKYDIDIQGIYTYKKYLYFIVINYYRTLGQDIV